MSQTLIQGLTLKHPWAYAIAHLEKTVENRTWKPHRPGFWLAIHGGAVPKGKARREAAQDLESLIEKGMAPASNLETFIAPGIVCVAFLERVIHVNDELEPLISNPWFAGPYGWILTQVTPFAEPVPCAGAQGLWRLNGNVLEKVREQFRLAIDHPMRNQNAVSTSAQSV